MGVAPSSRSEVDGPSTSTEPARSRLRVEADAADAVAIRGRLVELALSSSSSGRSPPPGRSRSLLARAWRFSALLLDLSGFVLWAVSATAMRVLLELAAMGDTAEEMESMPGLCSRSGRVSVVLRLDDRVGFAFRNWTHHSPVRQRRTSRLVVELTSRMFSFSMRDSRTCTIWGRLYDIVRSCVLVRRGWSTRRYVCRSYER